MKLRTGKGNKRLLTFFGTSIALVNAILFFNCPVAWAEDWPTYMHDNLRSGVTSEELNLNVLSQAWVYISPKPVRTAWAGPAPWDPLHQQAKIPALRDFDSALFVSVLGNSVYLVPYFISSSTKQHF